MAIHLFDSLERKLRPLAPSQPDGVYRFYNCGPTVYAPAHIGNFRTFVVNDVLRRLLELEFGPAKVKHVRNLTDVDDRTIGQSKKEQRERGVGPGRSPPHRDEGGEHRGHRNEDEHKHQECEQRGQTTLCSVMRSPLAKRVARSGVRSSEV